MNGPVDSKFANSPALATSLMSDAAAPVESRRETIRRSNFAQVVGLVASLAICFAAAAVGGVATSSSVGGWYQTLQKPSWNPPDGVFGPVWTVLYAMMAIAAWLVWRRFAWRAARPALALFAGQLALNVGWSAAFFGLRAPGLAMAVIIALWLAIAATAIAFWPRSKVAAMLLAPYLAWTLFAALLNLALWRMNA